MSEHRGSRRNTTFDFYTYIEGIDRAQRRLRDEILNEGRLETALGKLARRADNFLAEKGMLGKEIAIDEEDLDNCRVAVVRKGEVILEPIVLDEEDDEELWATYHGVQLVEDILPGFDRSLRRLHIVNRLIVNDMDANISDPLYTRYEEQCAILPIEDSDVIGFFEEEN